MRYHERFYVIEAIKKCPESRRILADMFEGVIDNFNVRETEFFQQHGAGIDHFINYYGLEEKNLTVCKFFYLLELLVAYFISGKNFATKFYQLEKI